MKLKTKKKPVKAAKVKTTAPKVEKAPEQPLEAPDTISKQNFIDAMRRLMTNPDFRLLRGHWVSIRYRILEEGKKKPSEATWSVLDGFDRAVMEPGRWATTQTQSDTLKRRAEELRATLRGETK